MFVKLAGFGETEKVEGFGWLEVFYGVAGEDVSLIGAEIEFHDLTGLVVEVDLFEVNPEGVGGKGRLEKVEETFVVGDGAPAGGGDVGLLGGGKAVGYGDVADDAEDTGERNDGILGLRDGVDVKRRSCEAIGGAVCSWQHDCSADLTPVTIEGELLVEGGGVGHDLILAVVVDDLLPIDVFDDGAVAGGVGHGEMESGEALFARDAGSDDSEGLGGQDIDSFLHGGEVVEDVLGPDGNGEARFAGVVLRILRLDQPEDVGDEAFFIHAVGGRDLVAGSDDTAVLRGPVDGVGTSLTGALHASGEDPEVCEDIDLPVHRACSDDVTVVSQVDGTSAGRR